MVEPGPHRPHRDPEELRDLRPLEALEFEQHEGLALGEKLGLAPESLLPTLMAGAAGNWFLDKRGATMLRDEFAPGFKCAHMLKDLRIVQAIARDAGIRSPTIDQAAADYAELVERGQGDLDTSALITLKRDG